MKRILGAVLILLSTSMAAQNANTVSAAPTLPSGVRFLAVLKSKLDCGKVEPGDVVKMQVAANLRGPDGKIALQQGASLRGRVLAAVARGNGSTESQLAILIERAEWAGGSMPLAAAFDLQQPRPTQTGKTSRASATYPRPDKNAADLPATCGAFTPPSVQDVASDWDGSAAMEALTWSFDNVEFRSDAKLGNVAVSTKRNIVIEPETQVSLVQISR